MPNLAKTADDVPPVPAPSPQGFAAPTAAPPPPHLARAPAPDSSVIVTAERREDKLGTAHGARERSVITEVEFERATDYPQFVSQIEYDSYDNLVASGVIQPAWNTQHRPRPFPTHPDGEGFVPDPPGGG